MADLQWFKAQLIWGAALENLSDDEAGRFAKAVWQFATTGKAVLPDGYAGILFSVAVAQLKKDAEDRAAFLIRQSENGKKGGRPMKTDAEAAEQPKMARMETACTGMETTAPAMMETVCAEQTADTEQTVVMEERTAETPVILQMPVEREFPMQESHIKKAPDAKSERGAATACENVAVMRAEPIFAGERSKPEQPPRKAESNVGVIAGGIMAGANGVKTSAVKAEKPETETREADENGGVPDNCGREAAQKNPGLFIKTQKTQA